MQLRNWKGFYRHLYVQVLFAIACGLLLGYFYPSTAEAMKPLGDAFIKLIKMMIAPIIFCTVVTGIAGMEDMKKVGRVGMFALLYFEIVSALALVIGLVVVNMIGPGVGMNVNPQSLDSAGIPGFIAAAPTQGPADFFMNLIPGTAIDAFAKGEILQVLLFALLFGFALFALGERGRLVFQLIDQLSHVLFGAIGIIMKAAPIGAFGAMAFTIGKYGIGTIKSLGSLMGSFYLTCIIFIVVVLGLIGILHGLNIFKFICYIKEELLIVLGTSSSESVLPRMIAKMENLGCGKGVVGLVIPTGYSFNLDGTSIYLTMAAIFVAQATNVALSFSDQLLLLGVLMLTSKGAAGVTGSGFVTLAATLSAVSSIPVAGLALILGIDRFMSEARALTNLVGNGVATVVAARWAGDLDTKRMQAHLNRESDLEADDPGRYAKLS